jgi:homoprotocatechuate degradation regulator HpaR
MDTDTRPAESGAERLRDLERSLPIALLKAREAVMAHFRPLLAERDFTEQQWRVLRVLREAGPLDPTELAERSVILLPSLSRILKALEARGMIRRERHIGDGRRQTIHLSKVARRAVDEASPASNRAYAELERQYGAEKMERLLAMLGDLASLKPPQPER